MPTGNEKDPRGNPWENNQPIPLEYSLLIKRGYRHYKNRFIGGHSNGPARYVFYIAFLLLIVMSLWSAVYTIPSDSVAVVQRFGKYLKEVPAGLHIKIPFGIDRATIVPVKRQLKQEFGFTTPGATDPYQSSNFRNSERETQMVTGDLNAALVEWVVQYRIADPVKFLFKVRQPGETLRSVSESVMREVVGDRTVDEVITIGRQEIEYEALTKMQVLSSKYEMGISIDQVQLKNINPPKPVQASFNEVNQAQQEKEKLINEARRDYNKVIPLALGEKDQRIREADGYRLKRINEAEGDVARFNALLAEYVKAPEVTQRRIYLETMQAVLPQIRSKIIIDSNSPNILPWLDINALQGEQP
ncbi:FtsH protease activity modulator HflK [Psychromonas sp.]|uniref:FtsH protease activity modulator HflK n=1 Tax=Psychromonas sp. TaxID=1884585 RepID=UPI0039E7119B